VRRHDEIGHLADSFNHMTLALKDSEHALAEWAHTLEQKVEEKTAQLGLAEAKTMQPRSWPRSACSPRGSPTRSTTRSRAC